MCIRDSNNLLLNAKDGSLNLCSSQNTLIDSSNDTVINSHSGNIVIGDIDISKNSISSQSNSNLNITAGSGEIYTQNSNLNLGSGTLQVKGVSNAHMPKGVIILWSGAISDIPDGWIVCDGTDGTPNLSGRFVLGSGSSGDTFYPPGSNGGSDITTISVTTFRSTEDSTDTGIQALGVATAPNELINIDNRPRWYSLIYIMKT